MGIFSSSSASSSSVTCFYPLTSEAGSLNDAKVVYNSHFFGASWHLMSESIVWIKKNRAVSQPWRPLCVRAQHATRANLKATHDIILASTPTYVVTSFEFHLRFSFEFTFPRISVYRVAIRFTQFYFTEWEMKRLKEEEVENENDISSWGGRSGSSQCSSFLICASIELRAQNML